MARVISFELNSQDPQRANQFYREVFGWKIGEPNWDYYPVQTGEAHQPGVDGGIALGPPDYPHGTRIVIEVENIDEAITKAVDNGANVVREKMEFAEFFLAYLVDPVGLGIGLMQFK